MIEFGDNPYIATSVAVAPSEGALVSAQAKSGWRYLLVVPFLLFGSVITIFVGYMSVMFAVTWNVRPPDQYVQWVIIPITAMLGMAGLTWLWTARSFWLARYRRGWSGAALGFIFLIASVVWLGTV